MWVLQAEKTVSKPRPAVHTDMGEKLLGNTKIYMVE